MKIILGDKSDNIAGVFQSVVLRLQKILCKNNTMFLKKLESDSDARTRLIKSYDYRFSNIPKKYHIEFISKHYYIFAQNIGVLNYNMILY